MRKIDADNLRDCFIDAKEQIGEENPYVNLKDVLSWVIRVIDSQTEICNIKFSVIIDGDDYE